MESRDSGETGEGGEVASCWTDLANADLLNQCKRTRSLLHSMKQCEVNLTVPALRIQTTRYHNIRPSLVWTTDTNNLEQFDAICALDVIRDDS